MNTKTSLLSDDSLDAVVGGNTPIYGMNCSANQGAAIKNLQDAAGSVPIVGGILAGAVQVAGWIICAWISIGDKLIGPPWGGSFAYRVNFFMYSNAETWLLGDATTVGPESHHLRRLAAGHRVKLNSANSSVSLRSVIIPILRLLFETEGPIHSMAAAHSAAIARTVIQITNRSAANWAWSGQAGMVRDR
jgi:hypothetical protein